MKIFFACFGALLVIITLVAISHKPTPSPAIDTMTMSHQGMPGMPGMPGMDHAPSNSGSGFDISRETLSDAVPTTVVDLADGDRYELRVSAVRKRIGDNVFPMLAYNGSIPGPVLRVPRGASVDLSLANDLRTLDTTLHSHGLRLDDEYDGVPESQ